jgi:hypothetical protein
LIIEGINLETYAMHKLCRAHHANHLENTCMEFKNMFKAFVSPSAEDKEEYDEEEE